MYVPLTEAPAEEINSSAVKVVPPSGKRTLQVIYRLREDSRVKIRLVNPDGKIRREFDLGKVKEGTHTSQVDVSRIPAGIYGLHILRGKGAQPSRQTVVLY